MIMEKSKKKRVSKRNKVSWRKFTKVEDIEEFLEEQRLDERLGLKNVTNEELFINDNKSTLDKPQLTKKEKCRLNLANPKCFQILKPHTNVPDPIVKRNRVRSKAERQSDLVKLKEQIRKAKGILRPRELDAIRSKKYQEKLEQSKPKQGEFLKDVWHEGKDVKKLDEWIEEDAVVHNLRKTGTYLKKVEPTIHKKTTVLPTIEPPHPGLSYNPSFEDHQDLLKKVAKKEQDLMKRDRHLNRVTRSILKKISSNKDSKTILQELSEGLPFFEAKKNEPDIKEEPDLSDNEYSTINPPVKNKKKTLKQRRKQKEQQKAEMARKLAKIEKKKISDLHQLRKLKEQVNVIDKNIILNKDKKKKFLREKQLKPKRLGPKKFEEQDLEFNMPEDVSGNLRGVKKESNLLVDRFVSLQKRNVITPTSRVQAKKGKKKRFVKPGHKEDWKNSVAGFKSTTK